jgi:SAM-dependent methyltransferase
MDPLYRQLALLSEPVRVRLLSVLADEELGVGELCRVVQLPQSTVSRHLKALQTEDLVRRRTEGTRSLFRTAVEQGEARDLWAAVNDRFRATLQHEEDRARLAAVLESRAGESLGFFGRVHAEWDALRAELYGEAFLEPALAALASPDITALDLGCGTGANLARLAPWVRRAIGVDREPAMLRAAAERLAHLPHVTLLEGPLESLPLDDATVDLALCTLVLHHVDDPAQALAEARRVLRPGGRLAVVDMLPHDRGDWRHTMGHRWLGFAPSQLRSWAQEAGFRPGPCLPLHPGADAQGPPLFVARFEV